MILNLLLAAWVKRKHQPIVRQDLPRGTDLSLHSQAKLSAIARQLNERPRKSLTLSDAG